MSSTICYDDNLGYRLVHLVDRAPRVFAAVAQGLIPTCGHLLDVISCHQYSCHYQNKAQKISTKYKNDAECSSSKAERKIIGLKLCRIRSEAALIDRLVLCLCHCVTLVYYFGSLKHQSSSHHTVSDSKI